MKRKGPSHESYGKKEVFDEYADSGDPVRNLWAMVIYNAIFNIRHRVKKCGQDIKFLSGYGSFCWICQQLGIDAKTTSKKCLEVALNDKIKIYKYTMEGRNGKANQPVFSSANRALSKQVADKAGAYGQRGEIQAGFQDCEDEGRDRKGRAGVDYV